MILQDRGLAVWEATLLATVATASIRVGLEKWAADPDGPRPAARAVDAFQGDVAGAAQGSTDLGARGTTGGMRRA